MTAALLTLAAFLAGYILGRRVMTADLTYEDEREIHNVNQRS